jgi:hypothetical protein
MSHFNENHVLDFEKIYLFKMPEVEPGSGIDLVKQMQIGSELHSLWILFDHVKLVKHWTTMH